MPYPVLQHPDILDALPTGRNVKTRFFHVRDRLHVYGHYPRSKSTNGHNRGWLRIPLGGTGGNQYQLWWFPTSNNAGDKQIVLGTVREHDTHELLPKPSLSDLLPVDLALATPPPDDENPFTTAQRAFLELDAPVRVLKGLPGSGKTTALWEAAVRQSGPEVLYVTWSRDLASEAGRWFGQPGVPGAAPSSVRILPWDWTTLLGEVLGTDIPRTTRSERLAAFHEFLEGLRLAPSLLGPWKDRSESLYDELRACVMSRFVTIENDERAVFGREAYERARAEEELSSSAITAATLIADRLPLTDLDALSRLFAEPVAALRCQRVLDEQGAPPSLQTITGIVVDEVQDLTSADLDFLRSLATAIGTAVKLVLAGDEGQTVRPTGFAWARVKDGFGSATHPAQEQMLRSSLRCSRAIAAALEEATSLYRTLPKEWRPGGGSWSDASDLEAGSVTLVEVSSAEQARDRIQAWLSADRVVLCASLELPAWLQELSDGDILTPDVAKGLEYPLVCVVGARAALVEILDEDSDQRLDVLHRRTRIDGLRVALSRAADDLIVLELADDLHTREGDKLKEILGVEPESTARMIELAARDQDPVELVQQLVSLARTSVVDEPGRAWAAIVRAFKHAVDEELDQEPAAQLLLTVAAALLMAPRLPSDLSRAQVRDAARGAEDGLRLPELVDVLLAIDRPLAELSPAERAAWLLDLSALSADEHLPDLLMVLRPRRQQLLYDLSACDEAWQALTRRGPGALDEAVRWLQGEDRLDEAARRSLCLQAVERALDASDADAAFSLVCAVDQPPRDLLGQVAQAASRLDDALDLLVDEDRPADALELARDHGQLRRAADLEEQLHTPRGPRVSRTLADIDRSLRDLIAADHLRPAERLAIARAVDLDAAEVALDLERERAEFDRARAAHADMVRRSEERSEARERDLARREKALTEHQNELAKRERSVQEDRRAIEERTTAIKEREETVDKQEIVVLQHEERQKEELKKERLALTREFEERRLAIAPREKSLDARDDDLDRREAEIVRKESLYARGEAAIAERERVIEARERAVAQKHFQDEMQKEVSKRVKIGVAEARLKLAERERKLSHLAKSHARREMTLDSRESSLEDRERNLRNRETILRASKNAQSNAPREAPARASTSYAAHADSHSSGPPNAPDNLAKPRCENSTLSPWVLSSYYGVKKAVIRGLLPRVGLSVADWETNLPPHRANALENLIRAHLGIEEG